MIDGLTFSAMGQSPADAKERLRNRLWMEGQITPPTVTLEHLITQYLSHIKYTSDKYQIEAKRQLKKFDHLSHFPATHFTRRIIQREIDRLAPNYKRSSLETTKKYLYSVFQLAEDDGYIQGNPCRNIKLPKENFIPKECFTDEELAKLIEANWDYAILPFIVLGGILGIGPGEVSGILPEHFSGLMLTVPGTKAKGRYRLLPCPSELFNLIKHTPHPWYYHSSNSNRALAEACKRAGIDKRGRTIYSLRHTAATEYGEMGMPHDYIARLLGHANKTMTMHYSKVSANVLTPFVERRLSNIYTFFGNNLGMQHFL